jgi:hypothetical protein
MRPGTIPRLVKALMQAVEEHGEDNAFTCGELASTVSWCMAFGQAGRGPLHAINAELVSCGATFRVRSYSKGTFTTMKRAPDPAKEVLIQPWLVSTARAVLERLAEGDEEITEEQVETAKEVLRRVGVDR